MAHLIDKDALVAEIEKLMNRYDSEYDEDSTEVKAAKGNVCHEILCTIDFLEVKEVDLDLTLDIDDVLKNNGINPYTTGAKIIKEALYKAIDKHISKAQKGKKV